MNHSTIMIWSNSNFSAVTLKQPQILQRLELIYKVSMKSDQVVKFRL